MQFSGIITSGWVVHCHCPQKLTRWGRARGCFSYIYWCSDENWEVKQLWPFLLYFNQNVSPTHIIIIVNVSVSRCFWKFGRNSGWPGFPFSLSRSRTRYIIHIRLCAYYKFHSKKEIGVQNALHSKGLMLISNMYHKPIFRHHIPHIRNIIS